MYITEYVEHIMNICYVFRCLEEWLYLQNTCPVCKTTVRTILPSSKKHQNRHRHGQWEHNNHVSNEQNDHSEPPVLERERVAVESSDHIEIV